MGPTRGTHRIHARVLNGLLRIGLEHHQQIICDKGRMVLTRTLFIGSAGALRVRPEGQRAGKAGPAKIPQSERPHPSVIMGRRDEEKMRPSGPKAGGPSAAPDLEPHAAWLADLQSFPGIKHEASGCRTDRATLPWRTARREVCGCDGPALADAQRGTAKLSRRQDLHVRCRRQLAEPETALRAGPLQVERLCQALPDWSNDLRWIGPTPGLKTFTPLQPTKWLAVRKIPFSRQFALT